MQRTTVKLKNQFRDFRSNGKHRQTPFQHYFTGAGRHWLEVGDGRKIAFAFPSFDFRTFGIPTPEFLSKSSEALPRRFHYKQEILFGERALFKEKNLYENDLDKKTKRCFFNRFSR
jgi:hypothetical protein